MAESLESGKLEKQNLLHRVFAIDLRTLAFFRIAIGVVLCGDMLERLWNVRVYYTNDGLLPNQAITEIFGSAIRFTSLHYHTGSHVGMQAAMLLVGVIAALALTLGWQTRVATIVSWGLFISLNRRVSSMCSGGDDLMRLMLFWSIFLPLGARWSLDAMRQSARGLSPRLPQKEFFSAATVAILLQLCYVYLFTGIFKAMSPVWQDGTAVQIALQYEVHVRPWGLALNEQSSLLRLLTFATLVAELLIPMVMLLPMKRPWLRLVGVMAMVSFHLGILFCMRIGTFPFVCIACWMIFLPGFVWDRFTAEDVSTSSPQTSSSRVWEQSDLVSTVVITLLLFVTLYNLLTLQPSRRLLGKVKTFAKLSRLDQDWKMYVRFPDDGWFVMPCRLADGSTYDIFRDQNLSYEKPEVISAEFPTARLKKLFLDHRVGRDPRVAPPLWKWVLLYYTREWNRTHPDRAVTIAQMVYMYEKEHNGPPHAYPYVELDLEGTQQVRAITNLLQPTASD